MVKSHALEITVDRRYASGLSANLAFAARRVTENRTVEAYDREPTLWQTSQNAPAVASQRQRRLRVAVRQVASRS